MRKAALIIMILVSSPALASKGCGTLKDLGLSGIESYFSQVELSDAYQNWKFEIWDPTYKACLKDKSGDKKFCLKDTRAKTEEPPRIIAPKFSRLEEIATYATIYQAFCKR